MPANAKYLTQHKAQKFAKISAAFLGGFLVAATFHLLLATFIKDIKTLWATYYFTLFLMWCPLMLIPFSFKNGWHCWLVYAAFIIIFGSLFYFRL